jgi:transposase-like protein
VIRLLRGEDLDTVSREYGVAAATLSQWREEFLEAGRVGLKTRQHTAQDDEVARLKMLIGKLTIDKECLEEIVRVHEARLPLAQRRSKP